MGSVGQIPPESDEISRFLDTVSLSVYSHGYFEFIPILVLTRLFVRNV